MVNYPINKIKYLGNILSSFCKKDTTSSDEDLD